MGRTLEEILTGDLGLVDDVPGQEKVAAANQPTESEEIEKLAAEIGLTSVEENSTAHLTEDTQEGQTKEASSMSGLDTLYTDMFPEDAGIMNSGQEKTAASEKTAAAEKEAAMGAVAYDSFAQCVDNHIEKIAETLSGDATISADGGEAKPPLTMKDNHDESGTKIDTTPQVTDEVTASPGDKKVVGDQHQTAPAGNGETEKKAMAYRKVLLLANLDTEEA